jgi:hypothetical protein
MFNNNALLKISKLLEESKGVYDKGIYIEAVYDPGAIDKIWRVLKKVGFKYLLPQNKVHTTIIYSTRPPNKPLKQTSINGYAEPDHFEILGGHKGKPFVLALILKSNELQKKHKYYMREYKLKYGFHEYKPHITVSYDIKKLFPGLNPKNKTAKKNIENVLNLLIPDMPKQIRILKENVNVLDETWS